MKKPEPKILIETKLGTLSLREISEITGIEQPIIRSRYYRGVRGDNLLKPISTKNKAILIEHNGVAKTIKQISEDTGLSSETIYQRYAKRGIKGNALFKSACIKHNISYYKGKKFGKLTIVDVYYDKKVKTYKCFCKCECGAEREYNFGWIRCGKTKSCGCLNRNIPRRTTATHNMSKTKEHKAWRHIKDRCLNKNSKSYPKYGGRGIKMCNSWQNSFEQFYADMGPAPSSQHSIDRIDVNGHYEPGNCRWATQLTQARNKRTTAYITYKGETKPSSEWAELLGIKSERLRCAYNKGADMEEFINDILYGKLKRVPYKAKA